MMRGFTAAAIAALGCLALPVIADEATFEGVSRTGTDTVYYWKAAGKAGGSATTQTRNNQGSSFRIIFRAGGTMKFVRFTHFSLPKLYLWKRPAATVHPAEGFR